MPRPPTRYINAGPMPAQASPDAAMAGGKALENLGHAIEQTGEAGMQIGAKSRKIEEGGAIAAFLADAQKQAEDFGGQLATRSDTDTWVGEWKEKAGELNERGKNLKLSPEGQARLNEELLDFTARRGINFETQARIKKLGIAHAQMIQSENYHRSRGDAVEHARTLQLAADTGIYTPDEVTKAQVLFKAAETNRDLQEQFKADPQGVIDTPDEEFLRLMPGATLEMLAHAKNAAKAKVQEYRAQELDQLEADLDRGILHPRSIEAAGYITPGDVAKLTKAMTKVDPPTGEVHAKAWGLLLANRQAFTDPSVSDHEYAAKWNDLRTEVIAMVPASYRGDLNQELAYRSPANRTEARTNPRPSGDRQELKSIALERITRARDANLLVPTDKDADPATKEKAFRRAEELRLQTSRFINDTPDLTIEKVTEFTDRILSTDRVKSTVSHLQTFVPGGGQRFRAMSPLPPTSGKAHDPLQIPPGDAQSSDAVLPPREPRQQLEKFLSQP